MLQALIGPVTGLLDKFIEDKGQKAKLAHEIATMAEKHAHEANMGQIEINKAEAQHRSVFVAGWRPLIVLGSRCGDDLALCAGPGHDVWFCLCRHGSSELPCFDMDSLMTVLLGMLGLGGRGQ